MQRISFILLLLSSLVFLTGCPDKESGNSSKVSTIRTLGAYDTTISLSSVRSTTINYTVDWSSSNGVVTGTYRDDIFARNGETITGSITNQSFVFEVTLSTVIAGVKKIVLSSSSKSIFLLTSFSLELKDENDGSLETVNAVALTTTKDKPSQMLQSYMLGEFSGVVSELTTSPCPDSEVNQIVALNENTTTNVISLNTYKGNTPITLPVTHVINMQGFVQIVASNFPDTPTHNMVGRIANSGVTNSPVLSAYFEDETNSCTWSLEAPWEEN